MNKLTSQFFAKLLICFVALSFSVPGFSQEASNSATKAKLTTAKKNQLEVPKKINKKRKIKKKRRKRRISKKKLEAYIKQGLEEGSLTVDRLNQLEKKYWKKELRYTPHVNTHPYMPHKWEFGTELGAMEVERTLYWVGANLGYNVGTCLLTSSPSCQQYVDVLLGSSGRDAETNWYGLASLRWQFVNFPDTFSPTARVFAGIKNRIANDRSKQSFVYGVGYGITTYLHPRANLRLEVRSGWGDDIATFTQAFMSVEFKVSRWLDFFAGKLEKVGVGTGRAIRTGVGKTGQFIEGTGSVIKEGTKATGGFISDGVNSTGELIIDGAKGTGELFKSKDKTKENSPRESEQDEPTQ